MSKRTNKSYSLEFKQSSSKLAAESDQSVSQIAKELGSTYIVVGRTITQSEHPVEAYKRCIKEFR